MAIEPDARPTIEALEEERRRLKELERNLAIERDRIQQSAAHEIARMQAALRDAADRAGKRERELESSRRKVERKSQGRRLAVFGGTARDVTDREQVLARRELRVEERERALAATAAELEGEAARLRELGASLADGRAGIERADALAVDAAALEARSAELDRKVGELVEVERRSAELLAARAAELDGKAAELREREVALEERGRAGSSSSEIAPVPVSVPADLRADQERLEAKAKTLEEADRRLAGSRLQVAAREAAVRLAEEAAVEERSTLDARTAELVEVRQLSADVERRAAELEDRATLLDAREAGVGESLAALERRERELADLRTELQVEQERLAERARRLADAERQATVGRRSSGPEVTFGEGIRALSRRSAG